MLSRVRRRPLHAAKRTPRARPHLHVHLPLTRLPRPHLRVPRPHLRMPLSPRALVVGIVDRWRARRADMTLERRRAHAIVGATVVFVCVVLLTSFPLGAVLSQRSALSGTARELTTVQAQNRALARQVSDLSHPAAINGLARLDYGFVPQGQRAYDVLPASSPSGAAVPGSGQVPLSGPPVVPGSARSQALTGIVAPSGGAGAAGVTGGARSGGPRRGQSAEPRSYWARVVRALEFWS